MIQKILLGLLTAVLLFVPTYAALFNYWTVGNWRNMLRSEQMALTVKDADGKTVFAGEAGSQLNHSMAGMLESMISAGQVSRETPDRTVSEIFDVTGRMAGKSLGYRLYYTSGEQSYLEDSGTGSVYRVDSRAMLRFLQEFFYAKSAAELDFPILQVGGNGVLPSYLHWSHVTGSGCFGEVTDPVLAAEDETYEGTKQLSLSFEDAPDEASLRILSGSQVLFDGALRDFKGLTFPDSAVVKVVLQGKWEQRQDRDYYGEAGYSFYLNYAAVPEYSISRSSVTAGEHVVVSVQNVSASTAVGFVSEPDMGVTPVFYEDGEYMRAIVPIPVDLKSGNYQLTVSAKNASRTFTLTVEERSTLYRSYDASSALIASARSREALAEYQNLLSQIGGLTSDRVYFNGTFADYRQLASDSLNISLKLGFGHYRTLTQNKETYRMEGVDFVVSSSTMSVPVLNAGRVVYVGQCAYLGQFVVVDHGLGLKTWYCHLKESAVTVGQELEKGQSVGKTGNSGFTTDYGVYLICTVGDMPISPYDLWDNGVKY